MTALSENRSRRGLFRVLAVPALFAGIAAVPNVDRPPIEAAQGSDSSSSIILSAAEEAQIKGIGMLACVGDEAQAFEVVAPPSFEENGDLTRFVGSALGVTVGSLDIFDPDPIQLIPVGLAQPQDKVTTVVVASGCSRFDQAVQDDRMALGIPPIDPASLTSSFSEHAGELLEDRLIVSPLTRTPDWGEDEPCVERGDVAFCIVELGAEIANNTARTVANGAAAGAQG